MRMWNFHDFHPLVPTRRFVWYISFLLNLGIFLLYWLVLIDCNVTYRRIPATLLIPMLDFLHHSDVKLWAKLNCKENKGLNRSQIASLLGLESLMLAVTSVKNLSNALIDSSILDIRFHCCNFYIAVSNRRMKCMNFWTWTLFGARF